MKEFDFDELDKAVTNLMGDVPGVDAVPKNDTATPQAPAATPLSTESATPTASAAPASNSVATPPASAQIVPHRAGRFMDMVHPTGDMTRDKPTAVPSRRGVTLSPTSDVKALLASRDDAASVASEPVAEVPSSSAEPSQTDTPELVATHDWPDPLDVTVPKGSADIEPDTIAEKPADQPIVLPPAEPAIEPVAAASSPFLSDTKVEKRPLGGSDTPPAELPVELPSANDFAARIPEELDGELMAIESGEKNTSKASEEPAEKPIAPTPAPIVSTQPKGSTSIQPQYKEEPSTGDQSSGAIFDTDSYHKPLAHPAKKKSGWLWVVLIVLLILLGAGAGAAAYFLGYL